MPLLEFKNVFYINDNKTILKDISFCVEPGDFISLVGPSGSGKSTILRLCCHLTSPTKGDIIYRGKSVMEHNPMELRKNIAFCFQSPYLFGDTVMDNLTFPYTVRNSKIDMGKIEKLFSTFRLDKDNLKKEVKNLSGGEKQRIALVRTLLFDPEVLLLDEVTSSLDIDNTAIVENVIESLNRSGTTVLWITHNPDQSRKYANKILTVENGGIKSLEVLR